MGKKMNDVLTNFVLLRAEIKRQLSLRNWNYSDLGKEVGYSAYYIGSFMAGNRGSKKAAWKIVRALGIPEYLAT